VTPWDRRYADEEELQGSLRRSAPNPSKPVPAPQGRLEGLNAPPTAVGGAPALQRDWSRLAGVAWVRSVRLRVEARDGIPGARHGRDLTGVDNPGILGVAAGVGRQRERQRAQFKRGRKRAPTGRTDTALARATRRWYA